MRPYIFNFCWPACEPACLLGVGAGCGAGAAHGEALDLVDEHADEGVVVLEDLLPGAAPAASVGPQQA